MRPRTIKLCPSRHRSRRTADVVDLVNTVLNVTRLVAFVCVSVSFFVVVLMVSGRLLTRGKRKAVGSVMTSPSAYLDLQDDWRETPLGPDDDLPPGPRRGSGWQTAPRYGSSDAFKD